MKIIIALFLLPTLLFSQVINAVEFKLNSCYVLTKQNFGYQIKLFDVRVPNYYLNSKEFPNLTNLNGIIDISNYFSFDPEISLRKNIYKKSLECGINFGYKRFHNNHDIYYNPGGDYLNTVLLSRVNHINNSLFLGIFVAYKIPKINTIIQLGLDHFASFQKFEDIEYTLISRANNFTYTNYSSFSGDRIFGRGIKALNASVSYLIHSKYLIGIGFRKSAHGSFFERIVIYDSDIGKHTHILYYEDKLSQVSINLSYLFKL